MNTVLLCCYSAEAFNLRRQLSFEPKGIHKRSCALPWTRSETICACSIVARPTLWCPGLKIDAAPGSPTRATNVRNDKDDASQWRDRTLWKRSSYVMISGSVEKPSEVEDARWRNCDSFDLNGRSFIGNSRNKGSFVSINTYDATTKMY